MKLKLLIAALIFPFIALAQQADTSGVAARVDSLLQVSKALVDKRDFDNALEICKTAEKLSSEKLGKISVAYGLVCFNLGRVFRFKQDFQASEKWHQEAKAILENVLGKEHKDCMSNVIALANLYKENAFYDKALSLYLELKATREKVYGREHPEYAKVLNNLANLYVAMGEFDTAIALNLQAKAVREKALGKEHPDYALTLSNLANVYVRIGDYDKAISLHQEAVVIRRKILGKEHLDYAASLNNLAIAYWTQGDIDKSLPLILEAKSIWEKILGKENQYYASGIDALAVIYDEKGDSEKGLPLHLEAKAIRERVLGKEHPEYAYSLDNLALYHCRKQEYGQAIDLFLESKNIREKVVGKNHPEYAASLNNLANAYQGNGDFNIALPLYWEANVIWEKTVGKDHHDFVRNLTDLANIYEEMGNTAEATALIFASNISTVSLIQKSAAYSSEKEILQYEALFENRFDRLLHFAQMYPTDSLLFAAFDNALFFSNAMLFNAVAREKFIAQADNSTREVYSEWKSCHFQLAKYYALPQIERNSEKVALLEERTNALEKELTRRAPRFEESKQVVGWQDVRNTLINAEAAVHFVHYNYSDKDRIDRTMYAALVLRSGDLRPQFIPLFEEKELLPLLRGATGGNNFLKINAFYASKPFGDGQKSPCELIWKPLEQALKNTSTVYCAPSGLLHYLNLAAIAGPDGKPFGDTRHLVLLGSTRSLAIDSKASSLAIPNATKSSSSADAYLAGGIRYESDSTALSQSIASRDVGTRSIASNSSITFQPDSSSARAGDINYLPATATEVREIGQMLRAANFSTKVDTGFYASEEAFRSLGVGKPSPRILHLATHGYFFPDPKGKKAKDGGQEPVFKMSEHPMIRSGLIMAGAKQAWLTGKHPEGQEDGILTAYEISQMNLSNTELVVLSACETGLGQVSGTEGVYGLQRAFKIAGVKYLIMSLWKVDDRSTQAFMVEFYKQWLQGKQPIPEAFRAAQQAMRVKSPNPYDWAGFVLIE